jgi:3-oxoacyl-[acyl-carrier-protein] synthase III
MILSRIIATGAYLPSRIVTNAEIGKRVGLDDRAIYRRTGIRERRWADEKEATSDLAAQAAIRAMTQASIDPKAIDLILVATTSPDMFFPSTACLVQEKIGAERAAGFDLAASCSGFIFALSIADQYLKNQQAKTVLVIAAEVKSRFLNYSDPGTAILFGDGAGAVLLQASEGEQGILSCRLHTDGSKRDLIEIPGGGSRSPITKESLGLNTIRMKGNRLFRTVVREFEQAIQETLKHHDLQLSDVDHFIFHQANRRMLESLAQKCRIPMEKLVLVVEQYGNTSSSSIPIALHTAHEAGRLKPGQLVLLGGVGGGLTGGTALIRW